MMNGETLFNLTFNPLREGMALHAQRNRQYGRARRSMSIWKKDWPTSRDDQLVLMIDYLKANRDLLDLNHQVITHRTKLA